MYHGSSSFFEKNSLNSMYPANGLINSFIADTISLKDIRFSGFSFQQDTINVKLK